MVPEIGKFENLGRKSSIKIKIAQMMYFGIQDKTV